MRIDEVVRVQNPMGGDFKSQLDRDEAAKAVRAQRKANRELPGRGPVSGSKSGTDPAKSMLNPGTVQTKTYNNPLTKQFARPAGQGKGLDLLGRKIPTPAQQEPAQQEPVQQAPTQSTAPVSKTPVSPTTTNKPWWATGQNVNIPAVQRKQQATAQQPQASQPAQATSKTVTPQGFNASNVMKMPGMEKYAKPAVAKPANFSGGPTGYGKTTTTIKGAPTASTSSPVAKTQPTTQPQTAPVAQPKQSMPSEPVKIGGQKLDPKNPDDARLLQMIQSQLPKMQTPAVAAVKNVADRTLAARKNKTKKARV